MTKKKNSSWRLLHSSSSRRPRKQRRHQQPSDAAASNDDGGDDGYESEEGADDASEGGITCSSKYSTVVTYTPRVAKAAAAADAAEAKRKPTNSSNDNYESSSGGGSAVLGVGGGGGQKSGENRHLRGGGGPVVMPPTSSTDGNETSSTSTTTTIELLRRMTIDNLSKLLTLPPPPADPIVEPITTKTAVAVVEEVAGYIDRDDNNDNNNKDYDEIEEVVGEEAAAVVDETSKEITNMQHPQELQQQQTRVVNNSTEEDKTSSSNSSSSSSSSSDKTVGLGSGGSYKTDLQVAVTEEDVPVNKSSGTTTTTPITTTPPVGKSSGGFSKVDVRDIIFGRIKYGRKKSSRTIMAKEQSRSPKVVGFRLPPSSSSLLSLTSAPKLANNSSSEMMLDTKSSYTIPDNGIEVDSAPPTRPEELLSSLSSSSDKDTCNWLNNSSSGPCSPMGVKDTLLERLCSPINEHDDDDTSDESRSTKKMNNITTSISKSMKSKFTNLCSPTQPSSINLLGQFDSDIGSRPWTPNHLSFDNTENNSNSNNINTTTTAPTSNIELGLPKSASKMLKKYKGREEEVLTNFKKMKAAKQTTSDDKVEVSESESTTATKERLLAGEIITSTTQSNNCWLDALSSPMDTCNQFLSCSGGSGSNGTHKHRGGMTIDNLNDFNSSKSPRVHSWPLSKPEIHSNTAAVREKQAVELITNAEGIITQQADDLKEMQTEMDRQQSHQRNLTRQVAELQIELTNVKAKERELEDLKSKTAQEAQQDKNALETQRVAHMEELQKLESNLRLECQQAAKLVSDISQLQSEIALHVTQKKKIYDERMQKESQTAKAIQKAHEEKLMILKDEHTTEAIAQSSRICELENQMSDVQSRYNILADLSKEAKAEADKKIRTQSIEVKKKKADWLARSEALAKLSQQVKDEAEEKMKTQAYELEKLKSDWMASSILNTELINEIDRLKRQRISDLSNEIDRLEMQHEQTTTVNDISVSAAAISSKNSAAGNSTSFSAKPASFINSTQQTVAPLSFPIGILKSRKGSKEEMYATIPSGGTNYIDDTIPSTLRCQNTDPESSGSGQHISDSSSLSLSVSVFPSSMTSERKKGWLRKLVLRTGLAVDCDNSSTEEVPSAKASTGKKGSLWLRKKQQKGSSIINLSVVEGESISSSDRSYTDDADDDVRESTDASCTYSINSLMDVHLNDSMTDEEEPDNHERDQIFDTSNSSSGIVETSYYDKPKKPTTNHWFSNVLNFGNADQKEEGRDEQEDQRRDVKSVRSRSMLPLVIL